MSNWIGLLLGLFICTVMVGGSYIRDEYDAHRWTYDPGYDRYGASWREVFKWWWWNK